MHSVIPAQEIAPGGSEPASLNVPRALRIAAILVVLFTGAHLVWEATKVSLPIYIDYEEGNVLNAVRLILDGQTIYPSPAGPPFVINPYPPLYYYLSAGLTHLLGYSFTAGRMISLAAALALYAGLALAVYRGSGNKPLALAAASLAALTVPARQWSIFMRPDALALALTFLGFSSAVLARRRNLAALLFVAAIVTKHTMVTAPAAVILAWWLEGRRADAVRMAAIVGGGGTAAFALFNWLTGGFFFIYMFGTHDDPSSFLKWLREFMFLGRMLPLVMVLAVWFAGRQFLRWWRLRTPAAGGARDSAAFAISVYLAVSFVSTLTGMKLGSYWNHYFEFWIVACLAAGWSVKELAMRPPVRTLLYMALALQFVLISPVLLFWAANQPRAAQQVAAVVLLAGVAAYMADRRHDIQASSSERKSRAVWAAIFASGAMLAFPGLWTWSLQLINLWPVLLAALAVLLVVRGRSDMAALAVVGSALVAAAIPAIGLPVVVNLFRERRRLMSLLLLLAIVVVPLGFSHESNPFHSSDSMPLTTRLLTSYVKTIGFLLLLAGLGLFGRPPLILPLYAGTALVFAVAFRDARLWLELGIALAVLSAAVVRIREWKPLLRFAPVALLAQLALLGPWELWTYKGYDPTVMRDVYAAVAAAPDPVVAELPGLVSIARKPMILSNPFVFRNSPRNFPEGPLLDMLRRKEVALIVMLENPWDPEYVPGEKRHVWSEAFIRTMKQHYTLAGVYQTGFHNYHFIVPIGSSWFRGP